MSSLLGPTTDADLRRWQRRRVDLLGEIITFGEQHELPPLTWTVGVHTLVGGASGCPDGERRAAFNAWADALGLESWEHKHETGRVHLQAETDDLWGRGVRVQVMADLWEDEPPA